MPELRPPTEKERVYEELERVQHKCAQLRREVKNLRGASGYTENTRLRREAALYRQALSAIVHHHDAGDLTLASARGLAHRALTEDASVSMSKTKRRRRREAKAQERGETAR